MLKRIELERKRRRKGLVMVVWGHLTLVQSSSSGGVTIVSDVHRRWEGGGTARGCPVHRLFSPESEEVGVGHRLGTTVPRAVHRPIFSEGKDFA